MWFPTFACFLSVCLMLAPTLASVCPGGCICSTTKDGLHRATCSNLAELYKFTLRQRHHNINILDLSHNNITKLTHELDRLTEIVTLDLSTNGITEVNKFLYNAKKLVHLNLAHNRLQKLSVSHLPKSVSSLDLTNNLLINVPTDLVHLISLEHLELQGNPLNCSCENIIARDRLLLANVFIDKVKCAFPLKLKGRSWLELKTKDICKVRKSEPNYLDMMMGDQPIDAVQIGEQTTALKSMPLVANSDLDVGAVILDPTAEDDDSNLYLKVEHSTVSTKDVVEGSGDIETSTSQILIESLNNFRHVAEAMKSEEVIPVDHEHNTEDPLEGSGQGSGSKESSIFFNAELFENITEKTEAKLEEVILEDREQNTEDPLEGSGQESGSGVGPIFLNEVLFEDITETTEASTTTPVVEYIPPPIQIIPDESEASSSSTEFPMPRAPSVYKGDPDWYLKTDAPSTTEFVTPISRDTTISEHIRVTSASENLGAAPTTDKTPSHKTGTYVCIAIIVVLLVGLIGFAIVKGQMRKRRDRRLLRQQKPDVEKASKEMVDMNKSLLGKPAPESPVEKKVNGKYELVPTHEVPHKKNENRDMPNGKTQNDKNNDRTDSPRDTNQNKNSSKDNNLSEDNHLPLQETSFESAPDSRKDTSSLSSEEIFVPTIDDENPRLNGNIDSDVYPNVTQPLINGDQNTDSDYLSPSREYVPVYSPDMGRVRIKMAETPKPKTPVLVTRSRSNAGDIIITPMGDKNTRKSTT